MSFIKNLQYSIEDFKLAADNLEIPDKGITVLMGPSGSGKSTFLNILIGLEKPQSFTWIYEGVDLSQLPIEERRMGVVFQSYDLFPHMTAEENIMIVLKARHTKPKQIEMLEQLQMMKQQLKIEKCWQTKAAHLSGGEKQRVALLRAVVSNPRILLLDEPFAALDESMREESRLLVKEFIHLVGVPAMLVTHDAGDVKALATNLLIIENGQIQNLILNNYLSYTTIT